MIRILLNLFVITLILAYCHKKMCYHIRPIIFDSWCWGRNIPALAPGIEYDRSPPAHQQPSHWLCFLFSEVKLTFEMLTVRGQHHSFSTHERIFLWKCQSFRDRKCLDLPHGRFSTASDNSVWSNIRCQHVSYLCFLKRFITPGVSFMLF